MRAPGVKAGAKTNLRAVRVTPDQSADPADTSFLPDQADASAQQLQPEVYGPPAPDDSGVDLPDQKSPLKGVYDDVQHLDPNRAAQVISLQKKTNESPEFIDRHLDGVQKALSAPDGSFFSQLDAQYPGTSKFLSNPENMAVTHDDLPNVAHHEHAVQQVTQAASILDAFKYGLESSSGGLAVRRGLPDISMPADAPMGQSLAAQVGGLIGDAPAMVAGAFGGTVLGGTAGAAAGTPGALPGIMAGAAIGGAAGSASGAFALPAAIKAALEQEYRDGKITSYGDILKAAAKQGFVGLVTAGAGGLAAKTVGGVVAPLVAETTAMTVAGKGVEGQLPTGRDFLESVIMVGGMHGAMHASEGLTSLVQAQKARQTRDFYLSLGGSAEASKLRERMPEKYNELVTHLTKDGPVENVFIPAEAAETYFQSKNLDPSAVMAELGVTKEFEEAKATGGDIKIPLATWAEKMVGTEHYQGLINDVKFSPDDLTTRELETKRTDFEAQIKDLIEKQKAQDAELAASAPAQPDPGLTAIGEKLQEQLNAAGLSQHEIKYNTQVHQAFFETLASSLGVTPEELSARFPLSVERSDAAGQPTDVIPAEGTQAPDAIAAQSAYDPAVVGRIRDEISNGQAGKRFAKPNDGLASDTEHVPGVSTYPEYFQKKGYTKKETLKALDKHLAGEALTSKQTAIIEDLYKSSGYDTRAQRQEPFLQGAPKLVEDGPRGRIRIGQEGSAIDLFKNADRSTFLHETGHYFLDILGKVADDETRSPQAKADYQTILKWLGVESRDQIGTEQHEKFARGFEQYLMEGKAPSSALQRAFNRFRKWLTLVYKHVGALRVDMNDDVRGVMDRMLASQEEIERAQAATGLHSDLIPGASPEVQAKIHDLQSQARDQAESHLMKEQMAEMTDQRKEFLEKERLRVTQDAREQVAELPVFKASAEAVETIGKDKKAGTIAEKFLSEKLKPDEAGEFEALAESHGFNDGEEMAKAMILAEEGNLFDHEVKARVEAGMAPHANMMNTDAIKVEALKAVHNEKFTELLALERSTLEGLIKKAEVSGEVSKRQKLTARMEADVVKEAAKTMMAGKAIKDSTNPRPYITAERNAAVKVAKAMAKGDFEAAAEAKRQQMLSHALVSEAMKNKAEVDKAVKYLSDYERRKSDFKDMPYSFIRQVDQLLSRYGFADRKPEDAITLTAIARDMLAKGSDPSEIANQTGFVQDVKGNWVPETIPDFVRRVNDKYYAITIPDSAMSGAERAYTDLTLGELRDLKSAVKSIADVGKKFERYLGEYKQVDIKAAAADLRKSVSENYGHEFAKDSLPGANQDTRMGKFFESMRRMPGALSRELDTMLTITHKLDGLKEGPAKDNIYRPIKESQDRKTLRMTKVMKEVDAIFAAHYTPEEFSKYKETQLELNGQKISKENLLSVLLNMGNAGNKDRMTRWFKLSPEEIHSVLEQHLSKKDYDFAQATWDHLHEYWPDISKLEMDVNGVTPKGVAPEGFNGKFGEYKGGYYPISYDFDKSIDGYATAVQNDALYKQGGTAKAYTDQGHTESRVTNLNRPVRLSLDVLRQHHEDVIHDLEFRRSIIDVSRFLTQPDTKVALMEALGPQGYAGIQNWLKSAAGTGGGETLSMTGRLAQAFRFRSTFFNLGYRIVSAPKIMAENLVNISSELGMSGAARAFKEYSFGQNGTHEEVISKSAYMKDRANHLDRDLGDIHDKYRGEGDSQFKKYAFFVHAYIDQSVSFPLWADVYKRAIADHGDEKLAVNQADEAVKRTFMTGSKIDQPGVMRGSEIQKAMTTAYGYQNMMWNRFSSDLYKTGQAWASGNHTAAAMVMARSSLYTFLMPAIITALSREMTRNSQNDNEEERNKRMVASTLDEITPLKFIPILRDMAPYAIHKALGESAGELHFTPMESAAETLMAPLASLHSVATGNGNADKLPEQIANAVSLKYGVPKSVNDVVFNFNDWIQGHGDLTWKDAVSRRRK